MSGLFGSKPAAPVPTPTPTPTVPDSSAADRATEKQNAQDRQRRMLGGKSGNILTSDSGIQDDPQNKQKKLLGA